MIDRRHGCYKDTSASEEAAALCFGGIMLLLSLGGVALLIGSLVMLLQDVVRICS